MNNSRIVWFLSVVMLIVFFSGCASVRKETDKTELLKNAAAKYWKLRFEDNYKDAYEMEDKSGLPEFELYRQKAILIKKFNLESYSIDKVDVEGDRGHVSLSILFYVLQVEKPFRQVLYEEWIFRDGRWLHKFPVD